MTIAEMMGDMFPEEGSGGELHSLLDEISGGLPDVDRILDTAIMAQSREEGYGGKVMDGYHPSFVCGTECLNAYYHHLENPEVHKSFPLGVHHIFGMGNAVHTRLQELASDHLYGTWECSECHTLMSVNPLYGDWLERKFPNEFKSFDNRVASYSGQPGPRPDHCPHCDAESKLLRYDEWRVIDNELGVTGKMDGVFKDKSGKFVGWEIKSANLNTYKSMRYLGKYKRQFGLYLHSAGFHAGIITVECKDNQKRTNYTVYTDTILREIEPTIKRMHRVNDIRAGKASLPTPYRKPDCRECIYLGNPCKPEKKDE